MGNSKSTLNKKQLKKLAQETGFSDKQVEARYKVFLWDSTDKKSLTIDKFKKLYTTLYPHSNGTELAERVFKKMDANGNGKISFKEFITALSVTTNGSTEERMDWVFTMYDVDDSGSLDKDEMNRLMQAVIIMSGKVPDDKEVERRVKNVFRKYDKDNSDELSAQEFKLAVKTEPTIRDLFADQDVVADEE